MFIQVIQGRATNPPGIRRDLGRWQRQLAADADGWLGSTAGITDDGWSVTVVRFASEDQAGFVQVIQGHRDDLERMASLGRDQEEGLARDAPHILGMTLAEHADRPGDFTQIMYFTSEQDARRFEQEPPAADKPVLKQLRSLMTTSRCFDL